ncbi:MAG TPA: NADH-quinone oxidoreductase subunit J, partial [Oscillatoriaceae cyanobacterium]
MSPILFYLLSALSIVSAFVMVSRRHPLPAATALVLCFVGLAGLFALLQAPLLAVLQILVYAGAIMALVVFVIMLLNVRDEDLPAEPHLERNLTI